MYTEIERYQAIKDIIETYIRIQKNKFEKEDKKVKYKATSIHLKDIDLAKAMSDETDGISDAQEEYWYAKRLLQEINAIFDKYDTSDPKLVEALNKHATENYYRHILASMAYKYFIVDEFPFEIEFWTNLEENKEKICKLIDQVFITRKVRVCSRVLLDALPFSPEYQELIKPKQYTR